MKKSLILMSAIAAAAAQAGATTPTGTAGKTAEAPKADAKPADTKPAEPKLNAGDKAIAACKAEGATNGQLLKALWSTRGNIYVQPEGFNSPVAIVKADMTERLKKSKLDKAEFILVPRAGKDGGADLKAIKKVAASKK